MLKQLTINDITEEVKSAVRAYLLARAYAEIMRDSVDRIEKQILHEAPLVPDAKWKTDHCMDLPDNITDPKMVYLADLDSPEVADYYAEVNKRLRVAKLKPDNMPDEHCPACVAETIQVEAGWLILDASANMLGLDFDGKELNHRLLCLGLDKYQEYIDIVCKLVVNLPDWNINH